MPPLQGLVDIDWVIAIKISALQAYTSEQNPARGETIVVNTVTKDV
jgi:hypothetical protein